MRYRSEVGSYALILGLGPGLAISSFALLGAWPMVGLGVALLCLTGWVAFGTRYAVEQYALDIRMGPFHRRIRLREVTGIHRRRLRKGPAFGLGPDFVGIEYGERVVNVSPRDVDGFVEALWEGAEEAGGRLSGDRQRPA